MKYAIICLILTLITAAAARSAENLIQNGDFETDFTTIADLASTWTHWGPNEGKIASNVTRDTVNPHGGNASLRIFRPANPGSWFGLVVTSPDKNAVRPKKNMRYTVSFWARTDSPGAATLGMYSYKKVNPFVDGPGVGSFRFETGAEWKRYEFTVNESVEFFCDAAQYVYLGFFITTNYNAPKTMWIDDVSVIETPGITSGLVNDATIAYDPIPLRLTPGDRFAVTVNAKERVRPVNKLVGGVSMLSLGRWTGFPYSKTGEYAMTPKMEDEMRGLRMPLTRFYGVIQDEPFKTREESMDKIVYFLDRVNIPQETTIIELEDYHANSMFTPEEWAATVKYCLAKGYKFKYWEIGNETYMMGAWGNTKAGKAFPTPDIYAEHIKAVSAAIRAVQKDAKIGLSISPTHMKWGNNLLHAARGSYDFVCPHWYGGGDLDNVEEIVLGENMSKLNSARRYNALIAAYNPGLDVYQYDSEWGLHSMPKSGKAADYEKRNANIIGTLYRAVRLLYYAREDVVRGAASWKSYSGNNEPGFGVLFHQSPEKRSMIYWLYYYFNRGLGDWVLGMNGTAPFFTPKKYTAGDERMPSVPATPIMASITEDGGTMQLMAVNASWTQTVPAEITLKDFTAASADGIVLSSGDTNAHPLLERAEDFVSALPVTIKASGISMTLPPHSIAFITVKK
ncbi:MAG: carbohydrate binding domain-containing protein [Spirochaetes bacterium]|nr:carbohydrate binding domain-containing protein [Spirochaetota bacterium]